MAVYSREDASRFRRALQSVFDNMLAPTAFVLVVDGPVPIEIETVISEFDDTQPTMRVHSLPQNVGLAHALNEGLKLVETTWVLRADSDDINRIDRFQIQANAVAKASIPVDLLGGAIQEIDFDGSPLAVRQTPTEHRDIKAFARRRNPFNHMTVAYRTDLVRQSGGYPNIYLKEDYGLWASMLYAGARTMNVDQILVDAVTGQDMYRRRGGLKSAQAEIKLQSHLLRCGLKTRPQALFDGVARSLVFIMPAGLRALIYKVILRK